VAHDLDEPAIALCLAVGNNDSVKGLFLGALPCQSDS
jgi:hypothetical protein